MFFSMSGVQKNQARARCGHWYHSKDTHTYCPACRSKGRFGTELCREGSPCEICKDWPQELHSIIWGARRPYKNRKKRTEKRPSRLSKCSDWVSHSESDSHDSLPDSHTNPQSSSGSSSDSSQSSSRYSSSTHSSSSSSASRKRKRKHKHRKRKSQVHSAASTTGETQSVNCDTAKQTMTVSNAASDPPSQMVGNLNGLQVKDIPVPSPVPTASVITVPLRPEVTANSSSTLFPIVPGDPMWGLDSQVNLNDINIQSITQLNTNLPVTDQNSTPLRDEREDDQFSSLPVTRNLISAFDQVSLPNPVPTFGPDMPAANPSTNSQVLDMPTFRNMFNQYLKEQGNPLQAMHATESAVQSVGPYSFEHVSRSHKRPPHSVQRSDYSDWDYSPSPVPHKRGKHSKSRKHKKAHRREKSHSRGRSHRHKSHRSRKHTHTSSSECIQHTDSQYSDFQRSPPRSRESSFHRTVKSHVSDFRDKSSTAHKSPLAVLEPRQESTYTKHRDSPVRMVVSNIPATENPPEKKDYRSTKAAADEVIQQTLNIEVSEKPIPPRFTMAKSETPVKKTDSSLPLSAGVQVAIASYNTKLSDLKELSRELHNKPENRVSPELPNVAKSFHCKDQTLSHDACSIPESFLNIRGRNRNEKIFLTPKSMKILESLSRESLLVSSHMDYVTCAVQKSLSEQREFIVAKAPDLAPQLEEQHLKSSLLLKSLAEDLHYMNGRLTHLMGFTTLLRRDSILTHVKRQVKHETFNALRKSPVGLDTIIPPDLVEEARKEIDSALPFGAAYAGIRNVSTRKVVDNIEQEYTPTNPPQYRQNNYRGRKQYQNKSNASEQRNNTGQRQSKRAKKDNYKKSNYKKSNYKNRFNKNQNR